MRYRFAGNICGELSLRKYIGHALFGVGFVEPRF